MKIKIVSLLLILALLLSFSGCILPAPPSTDGPSVEEPDPEIQDDKPQASGPVEPTPDGYTFETFVNDSVIPVSDIYEASSVIDDAIAMHFAGVTLDVSAFGEDFDISTDFQLQCEFSSHIWFRFTYSEDAPHIITVHINYNKTSASKESLLTERNTYENLASANELLNRDAVPSDKRRSSDFSEFPIDLDLRYQKDVYNSEELWWVIEHGYRPVFPIENSVAEEIYNQAKAVLRTIIYDGMSDYEKALAIYEYLVSSVVYDYDAAEDLENVATYENACYYLEGVFLNGRAVCDGKSKAFVLLCGIEGINAVREFGYSPDGTSGHAWNYVEIDGVWYLIDTTNGDVAKNATTSQLAQLYGKNVEVINYKLFLAPLSTFEGKYVLSGIWDSITETDVGQSGFSGVLTSSLCDINIDTSTELAKLIKTVLNLGVSEFSLVVSISRLVSIFYGENTPHTIADKAIISLGLSDRLEYLIFKESIDENNNYMYIFKLTPETETEQG